MKNDISLDTTLVAKTKAEVYSIPARDLLRFFDLNPGVLVSFLKVRAVE